MAAPHSRGVIQSPDRAISAPIAAYRGSSGPTIPTMLRWKKYRKNAMGRAIQSVGGIFRGNSPIINSCPLASVP